MFRALLCPSSGAISNYSRSLRFPYKCRGGCVSSRGRLVKPPPRLLYGNRMLPLQFEIAPDDGHNNARNMLSSYMIRRYVSRLTQVCLILFLLSTPATCLGPLSGHHQALDYTIQLYILY
jgi:hypothetical protein